MKKFRSLPILLVLSLTICSFTINSFDKTTFKISVKDVNHDLNEGLTPSEFAKMTFVSGDKSIEVSSFEITLARGNRAVSILTVESDSYDLGKFKDEARSGDRIVIQLIKVSDREDLLLPDNTVFTIKVN